MIINNQKKTEICTYKCVLFAQMAFLMNCLEGVSYQIAEVGINNIILKAQHKKRNLIFLITEAKPNFRKEFFDLVEAQRNSAIAEWHFRTKLKRNLTSAIEISQHNANTAFFAILDLKRVNIYQNYDLNGAKLSSMYRIALLTKKKKAQRN